MPNKPLIERAEVCHDDCKVFDSEDVCQAVFCYPCVMGSALTRATAEFGTKEVGLCPPCWSRGWWVCASAFCFGGFFPFLTGVYLRTATVDPNSDENDTFPNLGAQYEREGKDILTICLSSAFPICSCAPCQFNQYRRGKNSTPSLLWV
jgi:hypothetical protein